MFYIRKETHLVLCYGFVFNGMKSCKHTKSILCNRKCIYRLVRVDELFDLKKNVIVILNAHKHPEQFESNIN